MILRQRSAERAAVAQHDSTGAVAMYALLPRRCYKGKRLGTSSSAVPTTRQFLEKNPKEIEHNHNHYNRQCRLATQHTERECFKQLAFEKFISLTARKPFSEPKLHWCHMKSADLRKTECWVPLALKRCTKREKSHRAASSERQQQQKSQRAASANKKKKKIRTPSATRIRQEMEVLHGWKEWRTMVPHPEVVRPP